MFSELYMTSNLFLKNLGDVFNKAVLNFMTDN